MFPQAFLRPADFPFGRDRQVHHPQIDFSSHRQITETFQQPAIFAINSGRQGFALYIFLFSLMHKTFTDSLHFLL